MKYALPRIIVPMLTLVMLFVSSCSTHQVKTDSATSIKQYGQNISINVTGNEEIADKLARYLQAGFLMEGFNLVQDDANATKLIVKVSEFSPGNAALRLTVGLGAGRGSLVYNAKYMKGEKVLIDFDGAERFTGTEIAPGTKYRPAGNFGGEETATLILLEEATDHILAVGLKK